MNSSLIIVPLALAAAAILASCESSGPSAATPSPGAATASATSPPDGRKIYYGRCTSCHGAEPIRDYSRAEWREIVSDMATRTKLSGPERSAVLAYVLANAADS